VGLVTRYYFLSEGCCLKVAVLFLWGALSDERTGLQFAAQSLNGPSRAEPVTILYCLISDTPNLEGQVTVFISSRNKVAQLYPCELGSLYVVSYGWWRYYNRPPTWRAWSSYIQGGPDSIRQFLIINNQLQLPSIDNKRYFPIFPCVVGLIGY
jgi:hypothetical protein